MASLNTDNHPGSTNRIVVNNVAIKSWTANTVKVRLEYYFAGVGQVSVGAYRRHLTNFFGATVFDATPDDVLGEYTVWKRVAVFADLRNITDVADRGTTVGPSTPQHAILRFQERYGSLWTVGVKGTF